MGPSDQFALEPRMSSLRRPINLQICLKIELLFYLAPGGFCILLIVLSISSNYSRNLTLSPALCLVTKARTLIEANRSEN